MKKQNIIPNSGLITNAGSSGGLEKAAKKGYMNVAFLMILNGATYINTAFKVACKHGHLEIAKLMISYGANSISTYEDGFTVDM